MKKAKHDYYESLIRNNQNKSRGLWKCIKFLRHKQSNNVPGTMTSGHNILTDSQNTVEQFNLSFVNVGTPTSSSCQDRDQMVMHASSSLNKLQEFVSKMSKASESFQIPLVSNEFVYAQLKSLKTNKAKGIDDIGPYFLKLAADILSLSLCHVLNTSIITGTFPSSWKLAKVTPLYKKGKADNIANYRPISVLSTLSKLLERSTYPPSTL